MRRIRVIPILLIDNGRAVITRQFKNPVYIGDPINAIRIFNDKEVDELFILDISNAERADPDYDLIGHLASESFMPLAYGGRVNSIARAEKIISLGIEKLCFNTALFENDEVIRQVVERFGRQSVVASVDVKRGLFGKFRVRTSRGRKTVDNSLDEIALHLKELSVGEVLLTSIDRDGTMSGYESALIESFARHIEVPVVACGGGATLEHFASAIRAGASAVAAGATFYFKGGYNSVLINYPDQQTLIENLYKKLN